MEFAQSLPALQGIQRVADNSLVYTQQTYVPRSWEIGSILSIVLYTLVVFYVTEYLLRGRITRWLYLGTLVMVGSLLYRGEVSLKGVCGEGGLCLRERK